ncbi:hypothetical protein Ahy_B10g105171 [Arachis hypogaea]|uniref:Uncharacterized protein n=1 Tax=Arachis hypogaea TaxID=3818 RepID=A0A444X7C8_ARAHY|nr:hypothetical protein Ahy_B10g105171 [Arachis hypogaea]
MANDESFLVLVHYKGSIQKKTRFGIKFIDKDPFSEVRISELLAKLVDVVCSSGSLKRNPQSSIMPTCSSSMPLGASSSVPVIASEVVLVASSSFATELNRNRDGEIGDTRPFGELAIAMAGIPVMIPVFREGRAPDGIEDVLWDDDDDDDYYKV